VRSFVDSFSNVYVWLLKRSTLFLKKNFLLFKCSQKTGQDRIFRIGAPHFLSGRPSIEGGAPRLAHGLPHSNAIVRAWELGKPHWHGGSRASHNGAPRFFGGARRRDARVPPSKCRTRVF